ncbi:hemolysin family protein [Domibacillus sp. DTU_2020_1001157_1_SI_ALB_TIR_016]|uniref:hemolysin family protein n=1 Tax=Domibacillus sp. DTU_2020_1001157_1_SI_ALB_TIR_016 TaxID=3077789 RepID=UPI0028E98461|nr:hemolysin family protein [Domibacillus sp. DTU_2020_1001157_1_SI_ALB_TIR_016]WNS78304.1 hemolysin family protein [Domibacillus sp. DTU_2020_1001157_1_SI_ALB_TIR_016]
MDITTTINLFLLVLLLGLTAFFVAVEFAVVKIRLSRIDQLIAEGNKKAVLAKKVAGDLDYYLSACQLGITMTALGLGALGKPAIEQLLYPVFDYFNVSETAASVLSYVIAYTIVTFLHVVLGEMAPKTLAIQFSERTTLLLAPPLYWFGKIMYPFIRALNGTSRVLLRGFGVQPAGHDETYSEDELRIIMAQSVQGGEIGANELTYMENVFSFDERVAKDVMVPRTSIVALDKSMGHRDIIKVLVENNYTRYPVTEGEDKDRIIGFVNVKKMLTHIAAGRDRKLEEFVRELPLVHEVTKLQEALVKMQSARVHMALVIDEYGGTAGILTMEDILEELVGEIRDEFDADEVPDIRKKGEHQYLINGRVLLRDLEERFGIQFEGREEVDTIGGWIQFQKVDLVQHGDTVEQAGRTWTVSEMDQYQIKEVTLSQEDFKDE